MYRFRLYLQESAAYLAVVWYSLRPVKKTLFSVGLSLFSLAQPNLTTSNESENKTIELWEKSLSFQFSKESICVATFLGNGVKGHENQAGLLVLFLGNMTSLSKYKI